MNNHIHVAFASDDNYSEPLGVAIYSLVANLDKKKFANIYVLDGGISEQNKSKIVDISFKNFKVKFIYVDPKLYNEYPLYNGDNHTIATYYRLKLPSLFPNLGKIVYLDCDVVVNADISKMYSINIDDYLIAAIEEPFVINRDRLEKIGINKFSSYFNAGVGIFNLKKMRELDFEKKCYAHMIKYRDNLLYQDQDILNAISENMWLPLSPKYNSMMYFFMYRFKGKYYFYNKKDIRESIKYPYIIHYNLHPKPWTKGCKDKRLYLYSKYLKNTKFKKQAFSILIYMRYILRSIPLEWTFEMFKNYIKKYTPHIYKLLKYLKRLIVMFKK